MSVFFQLNFEDAFPIQGLTGISTLTRGSIFLLAQIGQRCRKGLRHPGSRGRHRLGLDCISAGFHNQVRCIRAVFRFRRFRIVIYHGENRWRLAGIGWHSLQPPAARPDCLTLAQGPTDFRFR